MNAFLSFCFTLSAAVLHSAADSGQLMNLYGEPEAERITEQNINQRVTV